MTPKQKLAALKKALGRVNLTQPWIVRDLNMELLAGGFEYTKKMADIIALIKNASDQAEVRTGLSDQRVRLLIRDEGFAQLSGAVEDLGEAVADAGQTVGELPQGVGSAVADGLSISMQGFIAALTDPTLWLRVGQVVLGVLLVVVAAAQLTGMSGAHPVGRVARALK